MFQNNKINSFNEVIGITSKFVKVCMKIDGIPQAISSWLANAH
jgi:hypothetical protein